MLDTAANLEALSAVAIGNLVNIDVIDSTDNTLELSLAKITALNSIKLTAADVVTLADSQATIEALVAGDFTTLGGIDRDVDVIDSNDTDILNLDVSQVLAILAAGMSFTAGDTVTIVDTGAAIAGMSASDISELEGINVDAIDANGANLLLLTAAQYLALGTVALTGADQVTLADDGSNIAALSTGQITGLGGKGVDLIDSLTDALSLTVAQYQGLGSVALTPTDIVTLADLGTTLATLTPGEIAALAGNGIDVINATDNGLSLTVAQYLALGAVNLTGGDTVTLRDTGAHLAGLSPVALAALPGNGIDRLDATDDIIVLNLAQAQTLDSSQLSSDDTIAINGTAAGEFIGGFAFNDSIAAGARQRHAQRAGRRRRAFRRRRSRRHDGRRRIDKFLFARAPVAANVDHITDFAHGQDVILIENASSPPPVRASVLSGARFFVGAGAHDATDRFIYNRSTGALFYDRDGTGHAAKQLVAILDHHPVLTHDDLFVV